MDTIFKDLVDDFGNKTNLVDDLMKEVENISLENTTLKTENAGLKKQLKYDKDMFETLVPQHSRRVASLGKIVERFFQSLIDELKEKYNLLGDLEEDVKDLPNTTLSAYVIHLMETNTHLNCEVSHLQDSLDELCEEVAPLQEDNN
jgi:regulator of replication initiation timing